MIKNKTLLILSTTEIGLLISLLYYLKYKQDDYIPCFILLKGEKERFDNLNLSNLPGEYKILEDKLQVSINNQEKKFYSLFKYKNVEEVIFQNPKNFISYSIINYYNNATSTLISDGLAIFSSLRLKTKIALIVRLNYHKYINKLKFLPHLLPSNKSIIKKIDCFIAHKEIKGPSFIHTNDIIKFMPDYSEEISKIFSLNINLFLDNEIIFFTQPIYIQNSIPKHVQKKYWATLDKLCLFILKNNKKMIIKVHPAEDISLYENYKNSNVFIDSNKNIPAEIILSLLSNQIIISMFSSVSLIEFKNHKNIWLSNLIDYKLKSIDNTSHILIPKKFSEIKNFLLSTKENHNEKTI